MQRAFIAGSRGGASVESGGIALFNSAFVPVPYIGIVAKSAAFPLAVASIILGHVGLRTAHRYGVGRVTAVIGLVCGYLAVSVILATVTLFVSQFLLIRPSMMG